MFCQTNNVEQKAVTMSEERKILSTTEEVKVGLYPKYGFGASILKGFTGIFLGVVPRYFTNRAIDNWSKSGFFKMLKEGIQIEQGDIKDIIEKQVKLAELTLTNQNFFFLYEKGFMSKQQRLIVFPLEHAQTVGSYKNKSVTIGYDVPQEGKDKSQHFDLIINVKDADSWAKGIKDLI
jgi:uncharacterized protein YneR